MTIVPPPVMPGEGSAQQFLRFGLPANLQAMLPTQQLTEILSLTAGQIVPIPDVPPQVMGVCNFRGEILWLVDLGWLLGQEPLCHQGYRQTNYSVIVVHHQGYILGLVVQQIGDIVWYDASEILPITPVATVPKGSPCLRGCWLTSEGKTLWFLDCAAVIEFFCHSRD